MPGEFEQERHPLDSVPDEGDASATDDDSAEEASKSQAPAAQVPAEVETKEPGRRERITVGVIALVVVATLVLLNWPLRYANVKTFRQGRPTGFDLTEETLADPVIAGWPLRYYKSQEYPGGHRHAEFAYGPLALDVTISILLALFIIGYIARLQLKANASAQRLSIRDLMFVMLLIAIPLGTWQVVAYEGKRHKKLAVLVAPYGQSLAGYRVPAFLKGIFPEVMTESMLRMHSVYLENPPVEVLQSVLEFKELTTLHVGGNAYETSLMDGIDRFRFLQDLRIGGRKIDDQTLLGIAAAPNIRTLNLVRTNIDVEGLRLLGEMPQLRRLNLSDTLVRLDEFKDFPWMHQISCLCLPRPMPGTADTLVIDGWPNLQELHLYSHTHRKNGNEMSVTLRDLPKLQTILFDQLQAYALTLENVPEFVKIELMNTKWFRRLTKHQKLPGRLWLTKLVVDGSPKISAIDLFGAQLKKLSLRGVDAMKSFGIGTFQTNTKNVVEYEKDIPAEIRQAWIDGLGESEGPEYIDLDALPLQDIDLSPLVKNQGIKGIGLRQSETTIKDWRGLKGMDQLTALCLDGCEVEQDDMHWLLENLPNLEQLSVDSLGIHELTVKNHAKIQRLYGGANGMMGQANTGAIPLTEDWFSYIVDLENLPSLQGGLHFRAPVNDLKVSNLPQLSELVFHQYVRPSKLEGLRDLSTFAAGGDVKDEHIQWLAECENLQRLALPYTAVSNEALMPIVDRQLIQLSLPGTGVTDALITKLDVSKLARVNLIDTKITAASVKHLMSSPVLESLLVNPSGMQESDFADITKANGLTILKLGGLQLTAAGLSKLLKWSSMLRELDLSDTELTAEMAEVLAKEAPDSLSILVLQRCSISGRTLASLAKKKPSLKFDLSGADVPTEVEMGLVANERIVGLEDGMTGAFFSFGSMADESDSALMESKLIDEELIVRTREEMRKRQQAMEVWQKQQAAAGFGLIQPPPPPATTGNEEEGEK